MSSDNLKFYGWAITSIDGENTVITIEVKCNYESYERVVEIYGNNTNHIDLYQIPANENEIKQILNEINSDISQHHREVEYLNMKYKEVNEILMGTK